MTSPKIPNPSSGLSSLAARSAIAVSQERRVYYGEGGPERSTNMTVPNTTDLCPPRGIELILPKERGVKSSASRLLVCVCKLTKSTHLGSASAVCLTWSTDGEGDASILARVLADHIRRGHACSLRNQGRPVPFQRRRHPGFEFKSDELHADAEAKANTLMRTTTDTAGATQPTLPRWHSTPHRSSSYIGPSGSWKFHVRRHVGGSHDRHGRCQNRP